MIQAIIFDLDGTLLDTLEDLWKADNAILRRYGYPERSLEEVRQFVGNGIGKLVERSLPDGKENPNLAQYIREVKEYYKEHSLDSTKPYPGIMELLEKGKEMGYEFAIVSNKPDHEVKRLNDTFFSSLISIGCGEKEGVRLKPEPDSLMEVLKEMNLKVDQAIYVGDSEVDIQTAKNAGMECWSVTWGFRDEEQLKQSGAELLIHTPEEFIKELEKRKSL